MIPQARGGRRKDARIIVPACARCNHLRGCQEIVLFLLARPHRITAFLEYLGTLPAQTVREIDPRIFGELYAAVWLLAESAAGGERWRLLLRQLCMGRRLHRRRYAARRMVSAVGGRLERARDRSAEPDGPSCMLPHALDPALVPAPNRALARTVAAFVGMLSVAWGVSAERVMDELARERERSAGRPGEARAMAAAELDGDDEDADLLQADEHDDRVVPLDGWKQQRRGPRRRMRVDGRRGRGSAYGRGGYRGGRAA